MSVYKPKPGLEGFTARPALLVMCLDCAAVLCSDGRGRLVDGYADPTCGATGGPHAPDLPTPVMTSGGVRLPNEARASLLHDWKEGHTR